MIHQKKIYENNVKEDQINRKMNNHCKYTAQGEFVCMNGAGVVSKNSGHIVETFAIKRNACSTNAECMNRPFIPNNATPAQKKCLQ